MLTLKHILASARMMEQTGGKYRGFYEDHLPEHHDTGFSESLPREEAITLNLGYSDGKDGDVRIVQL